MTNDISGNIVSKIDQRNTPRINVSFPLTIDDFEGKFIDINDNGISFSLTKPLESESFIGNLKLSSGEVKLKLDIVWGGQKNKNGEYVYGAKYKKIADSDLNKIRKEIIIKSIKDTLKKARNRSERKRLLVFARQAMKYFFDLFEIMNKLDEKSIKEDEANKKLYDLTEKIMKDGDAFEVEVNNRVLTKEVKRVFRNLVGSWAYKSFIVKRSFEKPRGYPGDFMIMEHIYDYKLLSDGIGKCYDVYFQNNEYAQAVRARKDWMYEYLNNFIAETKNKDIKILNIACGSNREIRELFKNPDFVDSVKDKNTTFLLFDQDDEALTFSEKELEPAKKYAKFMFLNNNIMDMVKDNDEISGGLKGTDLIYSIGLSDYLPDRVLGKLFKACFDGILNKGGRLVVAHKDISRYKPLPPNWFCDWNFYPRVKEDLEKIVVKYLGIKPEDITYSRDKTGLILFLEVRK